MSHRVVFDPGHFADEWVAHWNRRDVDAVLAHYDSNAVFVSPKAQAIAGRPKLTGRVELETYWRAALERIHSLSFKLAAAYWDEPARTLTILYEASLNGNVSRASEVLCFDEHRRIVRGEAFYGAEVSAR